jgi:hypothetical protein
MEDPPPPSEVFKDQAYMKQIEKNRKEVEKRLKQLLGTKALDNKSGTHIIENKSGAVSKEEKD